MSDTDRLFMLLAILAIAFAIVIGGLIWGALFLGDRWA